jgi:hypothetical protein
MSKIMTDMSRYCEVDGSVHTWRFDSVSELYEVCAETELPEHAGSQANIIANSFAGRKREWLGVKDFETFERVCKEGWAEGVQRMFEKLGQLDLPDVHPICIKRKKRRGDWGDEVDMSRVWRGELDTAWERTSRQRHSGTGGHITLTCDVGIHYGQDADELFWRAAAVIVLADKLENAGYHVTISAVSKAYDANAGVHTRYMQATIKRPDMPLDVSSVARVWRLLALPVAT